MIKIIEYRYAIICKAYGKDYIHKSYTDRKQLNKGVERLLKRMPEIKYRTAKIKITTEEGIS